VDGISLPKSVLDFSRHEELCLDLPVKNSFAEIYTHEEFHSTLVREKARADRHGHGFSLVAIEVSGLDDINSFTKNLQKLVRASDDIGWFDHKVLGVYLFNTSAKGAWKFVDKCRRTMGVGFSTFNCSVYCYPNEWCNL